MLKKKIDSTKKKNIFICEISIIILICWILGLVWLKDPDLISTFPNNAICFLKHLPGTNLY